MATSKNIFCGICEARHITKEAIVWCSLCEEGLCVECQDHHGISKSTRCHEVIAVEDYQRLSADIAKKVSHCKEHERKLCNYCPHHDVFCCPRCISKQHTSCTRLLDIDDVVRNAKSSTFFQSIEESLKVIKGNIEIMIKDRELQMDKIKRQSQNAKDEIKQLRLQINAHLDKLENDIFRDVDETENKLKSKTENLLSQLEAKSNSVVELESNLEVVKKFTSNLQFHLGIKYLAKQVEKEEKFVRSLANIGSLQQVDLNLQFDDRIGNMNSTIKTFGSISSEISASKVVLKVSNVKQTKMMSNQVSWKSFDDICTTILRKFSVPKGKGNLCITGCTICPAGMMIFTDCDRNKRLVCLTPDGSYYSEIDTKPMQPFDVTAIDDQQVAVTAIHVNLIQIIRISDGTKLKVIDTDDYCYGIHYMQGRLVYCKQKGIEEFLIDNNVPNALFQIPSLPIMTAAATSDNGKYIYHTDNRNNTVTCYTRNGEKLWQYKNETIRIRPYGITVDKYGYLYVASGGNASIVIITPDGIEGRQLLASTDGINKPRGLSYDINSNTILVVDYHGTACVYDLT